MSRQFNATEKKKQQQQPLQQQHGLTTPYGGYVVDVDVARNAFLPDVLFALY